MANLIGLKQWTHEYPFDRRRSGSGRKAAEQGSGGQW